VYKKGSDLMRTREREVKIAEKVKFWEEQDQINKQLIPRVIKNHELITDLAMQMDKNERLIAKLFEEKENQEALITNLREQLNKNEKLIAELSAGNKAAVNEIKEKVNLIEQKSKKSISSKSSMIALLLSSAAIIISVVSVLL